MTQPWTRSDTTGYGHEHAEDAYKDMVVRTRAFVRAGDSILGRDSPLFAELLDLIERHALFPRPKKQDNSEFWSLDFDFERLHRSVGVSIERVLDEVGVSTIELYGAAAWLGKSERDSYIFRRPIRRFVLRSDCPREIFSQTLEIAYDDAKSFFSVSQIIAESSE